MLYARSDVMSVSTGIAILESGGAGSSLGGHSRPVIKGAPVKIFKLDCPPCEAYLRGDRKPKILKYQINAQTGQAVRQERIADADPMWSSTPDTIPLTPDEERTNKTRTERGRMQIEMLQALAAIRATGINVPAEALYLLESELPEGVLKGTVVCAQGHDNAAGVKFCSECGTPMNVRGAIGGAPEGPPGEPEIDLGRLHPQTLRKMCRERELPDKGSKDALIGRLQAAALASLLEPGGGAVPAMRRRPESSARRRPRLRLRPPRAQRCGDGVCAASTLVMISTASGSARKCAKASRIRRHKGTSALTESR